MPRRPRIHLDGVPLHIVQRGHNREPCFFGEDDYSSYLRWLSEARGEADCKLHAYVLMTNHVHLLLTPKKAEAVQKLIIPLGRRYVQYINRTYRRTGTLGDSRYKSSVVQAETYLLTCQRYIRRTKGASSIFLRCAARAGAVSMSSPFYPLARHAGACESGRAGGLFCLKDQPIAGYATQGGCVFGKHVTLQPLIANVQPTAGAKEERAKLVC